MPVTLTGPARAALAATRFADVRWLDATGSTNADLLALASAGGAAGIVLVADHQDAGRGRLGRSWQAPPESSLLVSVLVRPPPAVADVVTMAAALAMAEAVESTSGVRARLKWPNDLVVAVGGTDRKLAGVLAETDGAAVVVGIGVNVAWPPELPADLAATMTALDRLAAAAVDRADLLVAYLQALEVGYGQLLGDGGRRSLLAAWTARSATLGRGVRVELGPAVADVVGTAVAVTEAGHLVVETAAGTRRTFAAGDIVHLRPT